MVAWPGTLPTAPLVGAGRAPVDATLRANPEVGAPIRRRRFTAIPIVLPSWTTIIDGTQYQTLMTFHDTTLNNGSLPFDWDDPLDGTLVSMAFQSPPSAICIRPNATEADRLWRVTLDLYIEP